MLKTLSEKLSPHAPKALVFLRLILGISMLVHGYPKIVGGPDKWAKIGSAMERVGIDFFPVFWGFMAAFAEFFGGIFLAVGLFTRPMAFLIAFTMLIAAVKHLTSGDPFNKYSHPIELMAISIYFLFAGGGIFSLDNLFHKKDKHS